MKYYQHKETGELMASLDELLEYVTGDDTNVESQLESRGCLTRVVFPNKFIGNGVLFHVIPHSNLKKFKRISKEKFFELCPDFGQLRHWNDKTIFYFNATLFGEVPKRKLTFGSNNPNKETYENTIEKKQ